MICNEKTIVLKNGQTAVLRSPEAGDGKKMLTYIRTACGETDFLLRRPEEWDSVSVESEEKWIQNQRDAQNVYMVTCYVDGEVVGNAEIQFLSGAKVCHRAVIGIAVLQKYWRMGIGSAIFTELLNVAKHHEGTEIVELSFIQGNDRAKALYQKFGFEVVAEHPNAIKSIHGGTVSEYYMQKRL